MQILPSSKVDSCMLARITNQGTKGKVSMKSCRWLETISWFPRRLSSAALLFSLIQLPREQIDKRPFAVSFCQKYGSISEQAIDHVNVYVCGCVGNMNQGCMCKIGLHA